VVYLSVYPLAYLKYHTSKYHEILRTFSVDVTRSSSDGNATYYILPVSWLTSCFHIIEQMGENQRRRVCFVEFASWRHQSDVRQCCLVEFTRVAAPAVKSAVSDCILFKLVNMYTKLVNVY